MSKTDITYIFLLIVAGFLLHNCDKWDETADISHVSHLPEFNMVGGEFVSFVKSDSGKFEDPGVEATVEGRAVNWYYLSLPDIDLKTPGVYIIMYYAENDEGFSTTAERVVAVTYEDISENDLSGTYEGTLWTPLVESKVRKIDDNGLYKCEEVLGFPGYSMPGKFVDLGDNTLMLLPGEGYFGEYGASEGSYSSRILSWSVILLDSPYSGLEIPVTWRKKE
ncbi:MAG: hypothetical protein JSV22_05225 [Bacteroidales bacterium]|nr:MAG: hypothetical protein JSV22_05225 [Bacteroidales bacterium]